MIFVMGDPNFILMHGSLRESRGSHIKIEERQMNSSEI